MKIRRIGPQDRAALGPRIQELERTAVYPLGDDAFRIDHGPDYFAFFDRLGSEVRYYAALDGDRVVAVGCGVLRTIPVAGRTCRAWYLCDLKVHPDHRGRRIPLRMLSRAFLPGYVTCARGYGISMNPAGGAPNRVARLGSRFRWARISTAGTLELFSLDEPAMRAAAPLVARHRGSIGYLSLAGKKDIVIESTGRAMPLVHVQFGPCAEPALPEPRAGHVHMLCTPPEDTLARELRAAGHAPSATATIMHHRLEGADWRFVLTSDI